MSASPSSIAAIGCSAAWAAAPSSWRARRLRGQGVHGRAGRRADDVCDLTRERTHGRRVGWCYLDGQDVAEALVRAGLARDCPRTRAATRPSSPQQRASRRLSGPSGPCCRRAGKPDQFAAYKPVQKLDRFSQVVAGGVVAAQGLDLAGHARGWPLRGGRRCRGRDPGAVRCSPRPGQPA